MKPICHIAIAVVSGVAAAWLGSSLSKRQASPFPTLIIEAKESPRQTIAEITQTPDRDRALRQAASRCTTEALWDWLRQGFSSHDTNTNAVISELLDREGTQAAVKAMALENAESPGLPGEEFLRILAERDPWTAFDLYGKYRSTFGPAWGGEALDKCLDAAGQVSADRMLEILKAADGNPKMFYPPATYAPGFDFQAVLDFSMQKGVGPTIEPSRLVGQWAARAPGQAAAWIAENSLSKPDVLQEGWLLRSVMASASRCDDPQARESAIRSLATLPDEARQKAWESAASEEKGKLDPRMLDAATTLGARDVFLSKSLRSISGNAPLDPAWRTVSESERDAIMSSTLARWEKEEPSPVAAKARERWKATVLRKWNEISQ